MFEFALICLNKQCMAATQHELDEHLKIVRKQVKQSSLEYITVAGVEVSQLSGPSVFQLELIHC